METRLVFLLLLSVLLQVTYIKGQVGVYQRNEGVATPPDSGHAPSRPGAENPGETFLDSLVGEGNDMTSTFVLEALQGLHRRHVECSMNLSTVEIKHTKDMEKLIKYYRSMENLIAVPQYAKFSGEDRSSVESNFHRTMKYMEKMRDQKLQKMKVHCDSEQHEWLSTRFLSMVIHAKRLMADGREQYREMETRMRFCRERMQQHLETCRSSTNSFGLLYCYVDELETLLRMIDQFLAAMQEIANIHFGDDEDLMVAGSGGGSAVGDDIPDDTVNGPDDDPNGGQDLNLDPNAEETVTEGIAPDEISTDPESPSHIVHKIQLPPGFFGAGPVIIDPHKDTPTTKTKLPSPSPTDTTTVHKMQLPPGFFGLGPVIIDPQKDTPTTKTTPTPPGLPSDPTQEDQDRAEDDVTPTSADETTPISSQSSPKNGAEISVTGSQDGEDTAGDSTQTPLTQSTSQAQDTPPWLGRAFDEVLEREGGRPSSSNSGTSGKSRPQGGNVQGLGVDVQVQENGDGGEVDISVALDSNQGPIHESIFLDPDSTPTSTEDDQSWSYATYILIYFFLSLAVIVLIFAVVVVTMVTIWRARARRRSTKDTPLISEREMLDVMKKTGYVNPTYKFYSQS